jgi:predicted transcriptional regulator
MSAIVSLGGCSAAFVSDQGLIATNYHCIERSYLQFNSNAENNLFETGFVARSKRREKKSAPGSRVYVTLESNDITEQVLMGVKDETADIRKSKNYRRKH